jgi:hypothetical protein
MVRYQEFCMFYIYMDPFLKGMPQLYLREVTLLGHSTVFNDPNRSFVSLYSQIIIAKMKQIGTICHLTMTICIEEYGDFDEH